MNPRKIVIDGKTYNSVDEMPEDVRRNYEEAMRGLSSVHPAEQVPMQSPNNIFADTNHNGMPDIMENQQAINIAGGMRFVVDGKSYNSVDELPPDARAKYEQAMGAMDGNRNGIPDFLEGMMYVSNQAAQPANTITSFTPEPARHIASAPMPASPAIAPDTSNGGMLILAIGALMFLCAAGAFGAWYFFFR